MSRADQVERLDALVGMEIDGYADLLRASETHRQALLAGDREQMSDTLREQVAAVEHCRKASEERVAAGDALAAELGLGTPCAIGRLIATLPGEQKGLQAARGRLLELVGELRAMNATNRRLGEHRLDLLRGDFEALHDLVATASGRNEADGHPVEGSLLSLKA